MSYPRGYKTEDLEKEIDRLGDESPNSHLGASYYARASLGLTELERRNSSFLGWTTLVISLLALLFSIRALKYTAVQTELTELQSRGDRILQLQLINKGLERCKNNPTLEDSGLSDTTTGKNMSCWELNKIVEENKSLWTKINNSISKVIP